MKQEGLDDTALGLKLDPIVKSGAVRKWRFGETEPRRAHRRQLIDLSKGAINPQHFT